MKICHCTLLVLLFCSQVVAASGDYQVSFKDSDLNAFVDAVAGVTGKTMITKQPLKGKVTVQSEHLNQQQYLELFRSILRANGYSTVDIGNTIRIDEGGVKTLGNLRHKLGDDGSEGEIVTQVLTLKTTPVNEVLAQLAQFTTNNPDIALTAISSANLLVLTGYVDMVKKVMLLTEKIDGQKNSRGDVILLNNASASELSRVVTNLINSGNYNSGADKSSVVADNRTNSLIVNGSDASRKKLGSLIRELDKETEYGNNNDVVYLKYAKAESVEGILQKLLETKDNRNNDVSVVAAANINAIVISAPKEKQTLISNLIHRLDIRRAQVHVEAMIVEIADADGINFGVQWGDNKGSLMQFTNGSQIPLGAYTAAQEAAKDQSGSTVISENGATTVNPDSQGDLSALMALLNGYNGAAISVVKGNWTALIQALKSNSKANILSTPSLTTLDNESASFMVGQNVPVLTGSTVSSDNTNPFQTVDRRDVGTKLTVLPQINEGEAVQLKLNAEVSKIEGSTGLDVTFAERKLDTTVLVNDGSMLVLGGLIDTQEDESEYKVPILGDIPLLGHLFSSKSKRSQKRNLMIFIRPTIIRDGITADGISQKKYSYIRAQQLFNDHTSNMDNTEFLSVNDLPEIVALNQLKSGK